MGTHARTDGMDARAALKAALALAVGWLAVEVRRLRAELKRPEPRPEVRPVRAGRAFVPRG